MCGSSMLSCFLLLAAYECGNTSAAAVYDVSHTTVDIKSLLPYITLVAPMDYWLCVSVCLCVSVFWRYRPNVQMLRASLSESLVMFWQLINLGFYVKKSAYQREKRVFQLTAVPVSTCTAYGASWNTWTTSKKVDICWKLTINTIFLSQVYGSQIHVVRYAWCILLQVKPISRIC